MPKDIDEDLIEATIRRVAESKAARASAPIEMPVGESIAPEIDEPTVENAIAAAERNETHVSPPTQAPALADDDDDYEVAPTPLRAAMSGSVAGGRSAPAHAPITRPAPARPIAIREPMTAQEPHPNSDRISADLAGELRAINQRLDVITSLVEKLAKGAGGPGAGMGSRPGSGPAVGPAWEQAQASSNSRPAIFRDDGARQPQPDPEPEIIDTRPIPAPLPPINVEPKRGFDLLPRSYRITVEDKRRGVDLVPLHRAMLSMEHVRDMSLLSYNNGVAIVALETTDELNPDELGAQVSRAMSREAKVEVHNEHTMVVKLADE